MILLYPAVLYVLLAEEYKDITLVLVLLLYGNVLALHTLQEYGVSLLVGCGRVAYYVERMVGKARTHFVEVLDSVRKRVAQVFKRFDFLADNARKLIYPACKPRKFHVYRLVGAESGANLDF